MEDRKLRKNWDGTWTTGGSIVVNPGSNMCIQENTQGFFIAESADQAKRFAVDNVFLLHFCSEHHFGTVA